MFEEKLFNEWKAEQYKDQSDEERLEFVEHVHTFPKYFEKTFIDGYNSAIKWFDAKRSIPVPKRLGIYRYTIEAISDKGDIVCYDFKDKCWKKIVIEDEKATYVPVEIEMWCNKPNKEIE
jgi:hypothetical protein